jgi:glutaredoxin-related protein
MENLTKNKIQNLIDANPVMVFMKGTKLMPQCGFSNNVVQILNSLGVAFNTFDVLSDFDPVDEVVVHHLELLHVLEQFNRLVVAVETQAAD